MLKQVPLLTAVVTLAIANARLGLADEKPTLAPLLDATTPAVVSVTVVTAAAEVPLPNDPLFRRFFEQFPSQMPPRQGLGSGVIVDAEQGLILSNHHVVEGADEIAIVLADRRQFDATLLGSDAGTDIAVLQIDAANLTELQFADSDTLQVGDYVVAIGNPFGLGQTATTGIVSALGRTGITAEGYEDFIQTDASINPGNSGGALIDLDGALMGVNTAIVSPGGGNVGIGFAVPSNMARAVMEHILEFGEVRRGQLGILIQDVTPSLAEALSLDVTEGAIVSDVQPNSAAAAAAIETGDVVVAVNGESVRNASDLRNEIGFIRPGDAVTLGVLRDGARMTIDARVGEAPGEPQRVTRQETDALDGAEVIDIPPEHPLSGQRRGVLVTGVQPGSNAALSGLLADDVIVAVNRDPIESVQELTTAVEAAEAAVALSVIRAGQRLYIVLR